ncbi:hypothetical protein DFA_11903 [Cavenderia fasciculata]|uniref:Uncharacterized protein n=1 Tax=Cavenderia fasciculata TaxID=261658 RepID=F4QEM5_CACFS|nr:uncharacterized protein DFA_11903 [Cavenderia fasciculata]EGG14136.1 hypothetical protein DFA_11903 [Cavenderia fasciculata]|eukprot:XP_004350844.1 hypothetical protein DFA_11903 [Cavenderia fasciculata]
MTINNNNNNNNNDNNNNNNNQQQLEEEDEFNYSELSTEELISTVKDMREAYFYIKDKYSMSKNHLDDKSKEIQFQRKLLTEREDLLLQLQWDPNQDDTYLYQLGARDPKQANEIKLRALTDQMRVMEKGIFDRDDRIKELERQVELLTLSQISPINHHNIVSTTQNLNPSIQREGSILNIPIKHQISQYPASQLTQSFEDIEFSNSTFNSANNSPSTPVPNFNKGPSHLHNNHNNNNSPSQKKGFWSPSFLTNWFADKQNQKDNHHNNHSNDIPLHAVKSA